MIAEGWDFTQFIQKMEREGKVTRTFRRLDSERQVAVVQAIFAEAEESGPEALNIKRVAERAAVAVGSLYQYFGSREGLLDFAIEMSVSAAQATFEYYRPALAALPLREALAAYGEGGAAWAGSRAGFVHFFSRAAYGGDPKLAERAVRPIAETMLSMVRDLLLVAEARGELRPGLDLEATARVLNALTIALYDPLLLPFLNNYFQIRGDGVPAERTLAAAMEMILGGIEKR